MKQPHFYLVDTNSQKLKVDLKFFRWAWSKMTVNLTTSEGLIDRINDFLHVDTDSQKLKANQKFI